LANIGWCHGKSPKGDVLKQLNNFLHSKRVSNLLKSKRHRNLLSIIIAVRDNSY
jgi:hypothetical protein